MDDKALWSVRSAVIVLGLLLSAGSLGNLPQFLTLPWYIHGVVGLGVVSLLFSVLFGIGTYTMTRTYPGIGHQRRIESHQGEYDRHEWYSRLLYDYQLWITGQEAWNEQNGFYLFVTHSLLLSGTAAIVLAGVISLYTMYSSASRIALVVGSSVPVLAVVLLLRRR